MRGTYRNSWIKHPWRTLKINFDLQHPRPSPSSGGSMVVGRYKSWVETNTLARLNKDMSHKFNTFTCTLHQNTNCCFVFSTICFRRQVTEHYLLFTLPKISRVFLAPPPPQFTQCSSFVVHHFFSQQPPLFLLVGLLLFYLLIKWLDYFYFIFLLILSSHTFAMEMNGWRTSTTMGIQHRVLYLSRLH